MTRQWDEHKAWELEAMVASDNDEEKTIYCFHCGRFTQNVWTVRIGFVCLECGKANCED